MDSIAGLLARRLRRNFALRVRQLLRLRRLYLLRAELRWVPNEAQRLFALTVGIGVVCGMAAVEFHLSIQIVERILESRFEKVAIAIAHKQRCSFQRHLQGAVPGSEHDRGPP